jgi:hypothetical protein
MMKLLKIALLLVSILLLVMGGEGIYHAAGSRQQVALTCEQITGLPPRTLWLRVSGCDIDYLGAGYRESKGRIIELFFPVRPATQARSTPAALVVATRDADVLALAQNTMGGGQQPDQEAFLVMMLRIVTMLRASREVEGYARSGVIELLRTRRALTGLSAPLAPQVLVLDLHARPHFLLPGIEVGFGLLLLILSLRLLARRSPVRTESPEIAPAADEIAQPPTVPAPRRLPALMLLNLDPEADASAVEHAAPLGTRHEVARQMAEVFAGFRVDGEGHGTLRGEDWSLTLHLGAEEKVWTVTADARGDGSIDALETLAGATGWRLFVPKRGVFVDAADLRPADRPRV